MQLYQYVTGAVKAVSVAPNSCLIASASYDKTVGLWLTREARCLYMLTCKPFFPAKHRTYLHYQLKDMWQISVCSHQFKYSIFYI